MKTIDLHMHSRYSEDGDHSVDELFSIARAAGLHAISITDHDSLESIADCADASERYGVEYAPGVEVTTVFPVDGSQQHILGYYIDETNERLNSALEKIHACRVTVAKNRIKALHAIGFALDEDWVWKIAEGRAPTATAIMRAVLENWNNASDPRLDDYITGDKADNRLFHFYREYLLEGKPAYVPFESISTAEGIEAIKSAGGVPVLAHPKFVREKEWLDIIREYGILGIEAVSSYHEPEDIEFYLSYARKTGLLVTAGSDFHGPTTKPRVAMGGIEGNDYRLLEELRKAAGIRAG
ncbi:MAG TPA: PHP domain-containing protein [Spirochaetota bacterium]|nr:PHP domain-containing protein [Spirochaetota bacterium]